MRSIYEKSNPAIEKVFAEAGSRKKVMCVAFDYAKKSHTALVCNGAAMQLRGPFDVHNTAILSKVQFPRSTKRIGPIVAHST